MDKLQTRLKEIRKYLNLTQSEFGKGIGISQGGYGALETGVRSLTDRTISQICQTYNVNEDWLRTGAGDMFADRTPALIERMKDELALSDQEIEILTVFLDFPSEERKQVLDFVNGFATKLAARRAQESTALLVPMQNLLAPTSPPRAAATEKQQQAAPPAEEPPRVAEKERTAPLTDEEIEAELAAYRAELLAEKEAQLVSAAGDSDAKRA